MDQAGQRQIGGSAWYGAASKSSSRRRARYSEPYQQVEVGAELQGPGFHRRVYGFWDGDSTFRPSA